MAEVVHDREMEMILKFCVKERKMVKILFERKRKIVKILYKKRKAVKILYEREQKIAKILYERK